MIIGEPIVGLICLDRKNEDTIMIENVVVDPTKQGRGIGRSLMEFAEHFAATVGLHRVVLYTNEVMTENIAFYTHLGYTVVDRRTEDGYKRVFMERILSSSA
ncbi:MAG: GNAT family N-acetyltransferase [Nitrososphaerota archaeon]|nr:GNAT family N-acetyltransferase [Nitrososphaerota archaeon]